MAESFLIPFGAVLVALLLFGIFCGLAGASPFSVYHSIYRAAFGSWYAFQNTLVRAAPIMLCALCTALPMRLGLIVIGNEGALVMGGLGTVVIGTHWVTAPHYVALTAMALAGMLFGGLWIMAVGAMKLYRGVNEVISSLLMNYIAIAILNHLVNGPFQSEQALQFSDPGCEHAGEHPGLTGTFWAGVWHRGLSDHLGADGAHEFRVQSPHDWGEPARGADRGAGGGENQPDRVLSGRGVRRTGGHGGNHGGAGLRK